MLGQKQNAYSCSTRSLPSVAFRFWKMMQNKQFWREWMTKTRLPQCVVYHIFTFVCLNKPVALLLKIFNNGWILEAKSPKLTDCLAILPWNVLDRVGVSLLSFSLQVTFKAWSYCLGTQLRKSHITEDKKN